MLIKGARLTPRQRGQVLAAYVHRHTVEHPYPQAYAAGRAPVPTQTDDEWINAHAFYFVADGTRLSARYNHCTPHYLAD